MLQAALQARLYALSGPDDIDALLATADALFAVPGERPPWVGLEVRLASYRAHLYRCDLAAADACLSALGLEAKEQGISEVLWYHDFFQAQRVFSLGDFARSEALFAELAERSTRLQVIQGPMLNSVATALLMYERHGVPGLAQLANIDGLLVGLLALPAVYAAFGARLRGARAPGAGRARRCTSSRSETSSPSPRTWAT